MCYGVMRNGFHFSHVKHSAINNVLCVVVSFAHINNNVIMQCNNALWCYV